MNILLDTQKANQAHAKSILRDTPEGEKLKGERLTFMLQYFETFHCEWSRKKGSGVESIMVIKEPFKGYGSYRAFSIIRTDGTHTDISYNIGKIKKLNYRRKFAEALRHLVSPQIEEFRRSLFSGSDVFCPLSGEHLTPSSCHIDHFHPTFSEIVSSFLEGKVIVFKDVLSEPKDNDFARHITDNEINKAFFDYHKSIAVLRAVSIESNLKRGC